MCYCCNSVKNKAARHLVILSHSTDYYDSVIVTLESMFSVQVLCQTGL